jgi:pyridoxine 5-phosphate synthase
MLAHAPGEKEWSMTRLSVNLNKIATLRNSRGGNEPSLVRAAQTCVAAGAHGITLHPRPDLRHITPNDCAEICKAITTVEINLEGNPFAPANSKYPGFMALLREFKPAQATLVPDGDGQLTSDHGWDLYKDAARLGPLITELNSLGIRVSLFVDAAVTDVARARELGAARIEIYTGPYAWAHAQGDSALQESLGVVRSLADRAIAAGLAVNAGHDLSQSNLSALLTAVPEIAEVSIGHALIGEALYDGLTTTVARYVRIIQSIVHG